MRTCRIVAVRNRNGLDFAWVWRSEDGKRRSSGRFGFFHDCLVDAYAHGFKACMNQPAGANAPSHYALPPKSIDALRAPYARLFLQK
jgi:hypothetical protein